MSKDKTVAEPKTVEDVKEESTEVISQREEIENMLADNEEVIEDQDDDESTEEQVEEAEEKEEAEVESEPSADEPVETDSDDGDTEEASEESEDISDDADSEVEQLVNSHIKKDGKQKRIDTLTARNSDLQGKLDAKQREIDSLKANPPKQETTSVDGAEFTDKQLKDALKQAVENGDHELQFEIMQAMRTQAKNDAKKEMKEANRNPAQERLVEEINNTRETYSYLGEVQLYENSQQELNLNDPGSLLAKTAEYLYKLPAEKVGDKYTQPGGIMACVRDALKIILNARQGKSPVKENKLLKKKVNKNNRKSSVKGNTSVKADKKSNVAKSSDDRFKDELKRRASLGSTIMS